MSRIFYRRHHEYHRLTAEQCERAEHVVEYTHSVDESKAIASQQGPHIIIAGSGMATGGRILHHFKHWLADHTSNCAVSGYQAAVRATNFKYVNGIQMILDTVLRLFECSMFYRAMRYVNY